MPQQKGRPHPQAGSSTPRRCFPAPASRAGSRDSPPPFCRAGAEPAGSADTPYRHPPPPARRCTARPGIPPDSPPAPAAAPRHPVHRHGSATGARNRATLSAAGPRCGTGTAPGPRPGWTDRTGRAARLLPAERQTPGAALPRAGWAGQDIPVHKSRCAPAAPCSPRSPGSDMPRPPC